MKNFIKAFRLTIVMCVFLGISYVLVLWVFGKVVGPGNGNAEVVELNGKVVGAANVGQQFTKDISYVLVLWVFGKAAPQCATRFSFWDVGFTLSCIVIAVLTLMHYQLALSLQNSINNVS